MNQGKDAPSFPLTFAGRGEKVILVEIRAGEKLRKHLYDLGLHEGAQLRVVQDDGAGGIILAVKQDARLAIGRGMAQKMMVRQAETMPGESV